jgi:competence protein ComEA
MSKRILEARKEGEFKDWPDLMQRVKGVKEKRRKLSAEGLTVNGQSFGGAAPGTAKEAKATKAAKP